MSDDERVAICCGHATCQRLINEAIEAGVLAALEERARILDVVGEQAAARIVRGFGPANLLADLDRSPLQDGRGM